MKQLTCEMCGSSDMIKQDGVFVCQTCGTKYSVEEAKKMMVEGTVEVTGTVKVDNSDAIDNYYRMASSALEAGNNSEAEEYANKIIELAPKHADAWIIKGTAAGWQSTALRPRVSDAVTAFLNGIKYAEKHNINRIRANVADTFSKLIVAMVSLRCNSFSSIHNNEYKEKIKSEIDTDNNLLNKLVAEGSISFNLAYIYNMFSRLINDCAVDAFNDAKSKFGPEHINMSKPAWDRFIDSCDCCFDILSFAQNYVRSKSLSLQICMNLVTIGETARDSCSWKFNVNSFTYDHYVKEYSFLDSAKQARTAKINECKDKHKKFCDINQQVTLDTLRGNRAQEEEELARIKYWEDHTDEKERLNKEKESLSSQIQRLFTEMGNLAIISDIKNQKSKITELNIRLSTLGLFKGKEKNEIRVQILSEKDKLNKLEAQREQNENEINNKIADCQKRISEIESELSKSRGRLSASCNQFVFENAVKDGKLTVTPRMIYEHLSAEFLRELGTSWAIRFKVLYPAEKDKQIGCPIFLHANSIDSPITAIRISADRLQLPAACVFCQEATYLLMSLSDNKNLTKDAAEELFCKIIFDENQSFYNFDKFRIELVSYSLGDVAGVSINWNFNFGLIRINEDSEEDDGTKTTLL